MMPLMARSGWRFFTRHPWQLLLTLLSIALGTAVIVAVDLANESARMSFDRSITALSGSMTHEITAGSGELDEDIYRRLRMEWGIRKAAPQVSGAAVVQGVQYELLGIDPFAYGGADRAPVNLDSTLIPRLMTQRNSVLITRTLASRLDVSVGSALPATVNGMPQRLHVAGIVPAQGDARLDQLIVCDIATAQTLLDQTGVLSRIVLQLDDRQADALREQVPATLMLSSYRQQQRTFAAMTEAFRTNLTAMSLLAILVGAFLVYNTMTFSVLQRRETFAVLRMLGATGAQLFRQLLIEALLLGLAGGVIGVLLGIALSQGLLLLVTQTIADLYVDVRGVEWRATPWQIGKGIGISLMAVIIATLAPAREAAHSQPVQTARRSHGEHKAQQHFGRLLLAGVVCLAISVALLLLNGTALSVGFVALFLFIMAYSLMAPALLKMSLYLLQAAVPTRRLMPRLLLRGLQTSLSRTGLAIIALSVALSAAVGVSLMIGSFRASVADWLDATLQSDIYVSATGDEARTASLPADWLTRSRALSEVADVSTGFNRLTDINGQRIRLLVLQPGEHSARGFQFLAGDAVQAWRAFRNDEVVLVSEPFAYHQQLRLNDKVSIQTPSGWHDFRIAGIYQDYSASQGMAVMPRRIYERYWPDEGFTTLGLALKNKADAGNVLRQLQAWAEESAAPVSIRSNGDIRARSLAVFDRTFVITDVLRVLVVLVAFIGVFSALMALFLERRREYAILRATGITPAQLKQLVLGQAAVSGLLAGLLAIPLGWLLSEFLIQVINRRSFGWTLQSHFFIGVPLQTLLLSILAALLAALYPTWRMARYSLQAGLRCL